MLGKALSTLNSNTFIALQLEKFGDARSRNEQKKMPWKTVRFGVAQWFSVLSRPPCVPPTRPLKAAHGAPERGSAPPMRPGASAGALKLGPSSAA